MVEELEAYQQQDGLDKVQEGVISSRAISTRALEGSLSA